MDVLLAERTNDEENHDTSAVVNKCRNTEEKFFKIFFGDSTVPTDAGIEPRTIATGALAVRCSNH
jgi:hypothetical protein